jgi:hypothetical protein
MIGHGTMQENGRSSMGKTQGLLVAVCQAHLREVRDRQRRQLPYVEPCLLASSGQARLERGLCGGRRPISPRAGAVLPHAAKHRLLTVFLAVIRQARRRVTFSGTPRSLACTAGHGEASRPPCSLASGMLCAWRLTLRFRRGPHSTTSRLPEHARCGPSPASVC